MRIAPVIASLALLSPAGSAATQTAEPHPLFVELARMCVSANGDAAATAERAREAGYSPTPQSLFDSDRLRDAVAFMKTDETAMRLVMTAIDTRRFGRDQVDLKICGVGMKPGDVDDLHRGVRTALGQRPITGSANIYAWLQDAQGRRPILEGSAAQLTELLRSGNMRVIGVERRGDVAMLLYMVPLID